MKKKIEIELPEKKELPKVDISKLRQPESIHSYPPNLPSQPLTPPPEKGKIYFYCRRCESRMGIPETMMEETRRSWPNGWVCNCGKTHRWDI